MDILNTLVMGDLADPFNNAFDKIKDFFFNVGGGAILAVSAGVFVLFMLIGFFAMKKSIKAAAGAWGTGGIALVVGVAWVAIKNIFQDVGDGAKEEDWTNAIGFLAMVPTMIAYRKYQKQQKKEK
ncbi:hypothetical protein H3997_11190 [Staphylococcus epidermidis]|uniref:hypothetical protein n=1 Tax=Bacillati TaxID=1783272 RepID=UPI000F545838|nr:MULTISPECIES: hypothetical protein [Staphylococcus]MBF2142292.1 hypothetical protein [Staphylococcus epidermidis]MBF2226337.1 hypothetical protein [Staphylococcus epidermidis]RQN00795.1 hypothetical protein CPA43_01140 [Staphylococcus warneri]